MRIAESEYDHNQLRLVSNETQQCDGEISRCVCVCMDCNNCDDHSS